MKTSYCITTIKIKGKKTYGSKTEQIVNVFQNLELFKKEIIFPPSL